MQDLTEKDHRSLTQRYKEIGNEGYKEISNCKAMFINDIARIAKKAPKTVKGWIYGYYLPDDLTVETVSKALEADPEELFPGWHPKMADKEEA